MKTSCLKFRNRISTFLISAGALLVLSGVSDGGAQERDSGKARKGADTRKKDADTRKMKRDSHGGGKRPGTAVWNSLSEEERKKLREVLRRVWSDPEVQSAREEVKNAAENYKNAVKTAVGNEDPLVAKLLVKVQSENAGNVSQLLPGRPPFPGDGKGERRGSEHLLVGPPGFLERLTEEQRRKFLKAQAIAKDSPAVKDAFKELDKIREKDESFRKERLQAFKKLRKASYQALLSVDPELKEFLPKGNFQRKGRKHPEKPVARKKEKD